MEMVITALIAVLVFQTVYLYLIVKKQDEIIDMHNDFVEVTFTCIEDLAMAVDNIEQYIEETQ